jgi:O-antigen/teichoic acid export membrane protein
VLNRRLAATVQPGPRRFHVRAWLATALPLIAVWGCYTLLTTTDILVLQKFRPADEVAHYYAASKTLTLVTFVYFAVAASAAHRFAAYHVAGDREKLAALVAGSIRWIFWPSLAATLAILACGQPLLSLFGPGFADAYPVMFVLAIGFLMRASMGPAEFVLNMLGEQTLCALVLVAAAVLDAALCLALVPVYGMLGAAIATSAALTAAALMNYIVARRRLELEISIWASLRAPQT